jgi:ribonucleoside-diphosphate reductase alpha chain
MNRPIESGGRQSRTVNRSQVARVVFANAEAMGIRDRKLVERLTSQVIERLEKAKAAQLPTFPGMEDMVSSRARRQQRLPSDAEIEAMVMEILAAEKPVTQPPPQPVPLQEEKVEMETRGEVRTQQVTGPGISLTETALHILEKRYLKKDKQGKLIETPEQMFRRVARTIAAAELLHDPKANLRDREEEFYQLLASLEFLPNSPTLMNAGRELGLVYTPVRVAVEEAVAAIRATGAPGGAPGAAGSGSGN